MDKVLDLLGANAQWVLLVTLLVGVVKALLKYLPELEPAFANSAKGTGLVKLLEAIVSFAFSVLLVCVVALVVAPQNGWFTAVAAAGILAILAAYQPIKKYALKHPDAPQVEAGSADEGSEEESETSSVP